MTHRPAFLLTGIAAAALAATACTGTTATPTATAPAATSTTTAAPSATTPAATTAASTPPSTGASGASGATAATGATGAARVKISANTATAAEIQAALTAAGVPNPANWTREVIEYRPYPADDANLGKLRQNLVKYNPGAGVVDAIVSALKP
ncbi:MAG: hypothetical protein WCI61_10110 [Chloroflexota bacterium]